MLMTGGAMTEASQRALDEEMVWLQKPIDFGRLRRILSAKV